MITLKELKQRVYSNKVCIYFEYEIEIDKEKKLTARFTKQNYNTVELNQWNMQIVVDKTRDKDSEVYNFGYIMPKENLPLELIAATGLKYFQLHIKEEVQIKTSLDFILGEITNGAIG